MWSDNETAVDLLGYQHLVSCVMSIVRDDSLSPSTIGVYGDWGGGKSSLLKMVEQGLEGEPGTLVLTFNGWLFEGYEDAKSALLGVILDEIEAKKKPTAKAKETLTKLLRRVNWFRVAGATLKHGAAFAIAGPAGIGLTAAADLAGYAKQIGEKLGEKVQGVTAEDIGAFLVEDAGKEARKAVREFRDDFATLLEQTKVKRLVVLIDDLDRCLPPAVIDILEAIKLFLFVPHTSFVIGADERLVRYAVRRRFPELPGEVAQVANEYLEKLIQYPVRIPALDSAEIETYINLLFASAAKLPDGEFDAIREQVIDGSSESLLDVRFNAGIAQKLLEAIPEGLKTQIAMAQRIAPVLASGLKGNPRQCKRFLNMLVMRMEMARSRKLNLKQRILAKLMLLEYLQPEWFRTLAQVQAEANGKPPALARLESLARGGESRADADPEATEKNDSSKKKTGDETKEVDTIVEELLPTELEGWLRDAWMKDWLVSEPSLGDDDLRPYFYFSRDRLGPMASAARRMTPEAQEALEGLLHESDAKRLVALRQAERLSPADTAAVFVALTERIDQEDDLRSDRSSLSPLLRFCEKRKELLPQLITFLGRIPVEQLPVSLPMRVVGLVKEDPASGQAKQLLSAWNQQGGATKLASTAGSALERL